jgi:D-arabinose 1-dehydrogenase-like Zn-dependent alcohol dehydrogenase
MLRRGGTCSLVGLPPGDFPTPIFDLVLRGLTVRGPIVGTRKDLQESLQFAAEGKVKPTVAFSSGHRRDRPGFETAHEGGAPEGGKF